MQLRDINVFLEIVRGGSFTAAAARLRMPKSSVARQLARLEDDLGVILFERTTRTIALTEHGRTFLPFAQRLLHDSIEASRAINAGEHVASGLLTVTATITLGQLLLAPHLAEFRRRNPAVQVRLILTSTKAELTVGSTDVAIRLGPLIEPGLGFRRLGDVDFWLVATPDYLNRRPAPAEPRDLATHETIVLRPPVSGNQIDLTRNGRTQAVRLLPAVEVNDPSAACAVARAGGGIAVLPRFLVAADVAAGRLVRVLPDWAMAPAAVNAVYSTAVPPPLRVRAYLEFLAETIDLAQTPDSA